MWTETRTETRTETVPSVADRIYVVVSDKLSRGGQTAQSIHAVAELADNYPGWFNEWINGGNTIIVLEGNVLEALEDLGGYSTAVVTFCEPDFNFKVTSLAVFSDATLPTGRSVQKSLQYYKLQASRHRPILLERFYQRRESGLRSKRQEQEWAL